MSAVLGAQAGAPETYTWTWRSQMAVSPRGNVERRTGATSTSRRKQRNADVDARVYVAASNAASGANDERHQVQTSDPPPGGHPEGAVSDAAGLWPPKILKILYCRAFRCADLAHV